MMDSYKKDVEAGNAPIIFKRACLSLFGLASELEKHSAQLNAKQIETIAMVKRYFK